MIKQTDPAAQYIALKSEIDAAVQSVLESGNYILGCQVQDFEYEFANYIGVNYGVGVANGTDGLAIALRALGVKPGDEVITVSHTAIATISAILSIGAVPVLVDIEPEFYTMNPDSLSQAFTNKTKAVIPVHLYGQSANIAKILEICEEREIPIIEDSSQAHGAEFDTKKLGSFGKIGVFSCYPTKNLGGIGDAGIVVTNDHQLWERMKRIRQYGWQKRNHSLEVGQNSRLDEIQASILRIKLRYLEKHNVKRIEIAERYVEGLASTPLSLPKVRSNSKHVFHQYVVKSPERARFQEHLRKLGIMTAVHYPIPCHLQPGYISSVISNEYMQETLDIANQGVSLPIYPELSAEDLDHIVASINCFFD